jgi:hypothetical protein
MSRAALCVGEVRTRSRRKVKGLVVERCPFETTKATPHRLHAIVVVEEAQHIANILRVIDIGRCQRATLQSSRAHVAVRIRRRREERHCSRCRDWLREAAGWLAAGERGCSQLRWGSSCEARGLETSS